ncbi:accessory gene regulator B family protein [Paenibacillus oenotherae]|uniref:Accessory gene regulator B family protein n=1 Tax=Paenibacillus oenotherae TaxID=1435645 RepID=A0ABS7DCK0_9BACL|nr:accessory gene regulator B family protein [Paenibacillus oenotherae]MBW7477659.1 accessory gene regulator B family protein [Paenibacillus oenotherae]
MQTIAYKLALGLKNRVPSHHGSVAVFQFAFEVLLNIIGALMLTLFISLFTGQILATCLALTALAALRMVSGGAHFKYSSLCTLVTAIVANFASLSDFPAIYVVVATSISVVIALIYAPSRIEEQTRIPKKYFPVLKLISVILIASNYLIGSSIIAVTFLIQSLTLIRKKRRKA